MPDHPNRSQGTLARVTNVGGSFTALVIAAGIAWLIRRLRSAASSASLSDTTKLAASGKWGTVPVLSPAAVRAMAELDPIEHVIIDVRHDPVVMPPPELSALSIPLARLSDLLSDPLKWPDVPAMRADKRVFLVFVSDVEEEMLEAAQVAGRLGFRHHAVMHGGLPGYRKTRASVDPRTINRDALAVLLGLSTLPRHATATVLDVRRPDELALYGAIPGTSHVPAAELPAALAMAPEEWFRRYRFPKPVAGEPLVMQCRTNRRATWAAVLAMDAGYNNVMVYKQGAFGWRLSSRVKAYPSYEEGDPPPMAKPFEEERINVDAALEELGKLGLVAA